jgi:FMN phosphatase YigB (HAD superfamily)
MSDSKRRDKEVAIFDLDGTIIDSSHRTPNNLDGTLNLERYRSLKTRENIFKDTLLPLADKMRRMYDSGKYHIVICTAREISQDDLDFLEHHDIKFHEMFNRSNVRKSHHGRLPDPQYKTKQLKKYKSTAYEFYDDALPIIDLFETYPNVTMVNANTANGVYQDGS